MSETYPSKFAPEAKIILAGLLKDLEFFTELKAKLDAGVNAGDDLLPTQSIDEYKKMFHRRLDALYENLVSIYDEIENDLESCEDHDCKEDHGFA